MSTNFHSVKKLDAENMRLLSAFIGVDLRKVKRMETYLYKGEAGQYEGVRLFIEMNEANGSHVAHDQEETVPEN